jgi:hypothetical protein
MVQQVQAAYKAKLGQLVQAVYKAKLVLQVLVDLQVQQDHKAQLEQLVLRG